MSAMAQISHSNLEPAVLPSISYLYTFSVSFGRLCFSFE